jgi:sigma-B regulation protein RsbU (phosphoserine phosphatase)
MAQLLDYLSEKYQPESVDEINRRLLELSSLFEISNILNESLELSHVLNNILLIPMGRLMIPRGAIVLKENNHFNIELAKGTPIDEENRSFECIELPNTSFKIEDLDKKTAESRIIKYAKLAHLEIAIPFISKNKCFGLALFGPKLSHKDFTEEEIDFLNSLASIATSSIENALQLKKTIEVNRQLDERIQELKTLFDIAQGLSATLEQPKILRLLVYAFMGQMLITRYSILLKIDNNYHIKENKGFTESILESICDKLTNISVSERAINVKDWNNHAIKKPLSALNVEVLIPMTHQSKHLGLILLGPRINGQPFTSNDLEFLTTLVSQAVISIENARLFQETLEKQRLEEELNVARQIQKNLLPKKLPTLPGYDIHAINISSKQVGGDYYDVIQLNENKFAIAIGDVSGKSVPAALLMANLQSALRVMIKQAISLSKIVSNINDLIYDNTDPDKYITFFMGILDTQQNNFEYVNAGHNPPFLWRKNGEIESLDVGGIILGMMPDYFYQSAIIGFAKEDMLITYTDGVNEAIDPNDPIEEEFGEERLKNVIKNNGQGMAKDLIDAVLENISKFTKNNLDSDDVTMLTLKRCN